MFYSHEGTLHLLFPNALLTRSLTRPRSPHLTQIWRRDHLVSTHYSFLPTSPPLILLLFPSRLVATLGSKSNLKKVSRKAILDVDVQKACETIVTPEAPMALRLQSNLLYGVARVYAQQCGYVLTDAETARNSMRAVMKVLRSSKIDEGGHKGR